MKTWRDARDLGLLQRMALRFLHTSDIHLLDLRGVPPWRYVNKRLTGGLNLALFRGRKHDGRLFDRMVERIADLQVDRVVVTGDLTNLALEPEFELCAAKLAALDVPATVIPGNHDAYTKGSERARRFERYLSAFMDGERVGDHDYPFMLCTDGVAFIGVSTAVATLPFFATGQLGAQQRQRLETLLEKAKYEGLHRVVLIHHPPVAGVSKPRHDLLDLSQFGALIERTGAELVLHGHEHRRIETALAGPDGPVPVHGIGSGTSVSDKPRREASFSVYEATDAGLAREVYVWNGSAFERLQD